MRMIQNLTAQIRRGSESTEQHTIILCHVIRCVAMRFKPKVDEKDRADHLVAKDDIIRHQNSSYRNFFKVSSVKKS